MKLVIYTPSTVAQSTQFFFSVIFVLKINLLIIVQKWFLNTTTKYQLYTNYLQSYELKSTLGYEEKPQFPAKINYIYTGIKILKL